MADSPNFEQDGSANTFDKSGSVGEVQRRLCECKKSDRTIADGEKATFEGETGVRGGGDMRGRSCGVSRLAGV